MKRVASCVALAFLTLGWMAHADELVLPKAELLRQGYVPITKALREIAEPPRFARHSLPWPLSFEDSRHTIGNVMTQFQDYGGGPYYHGGDDLRAKRKEWVYAPVSGKLEAGHYGYEMHADGSHEKYWMPWPQSGNRMYFEVAVVDEQGYRFELHHVDRSTLTPEIVAALNSGNGTIQAGQKIGQIVVWPNSDTDGTLYHHCHYNIISPEGVSLNPEYYSAALGDKVPPVIEGVYVDQGEVVVIASDRIGENVYKHTPSYARLVFGDGAESKWDFRERLRGPDGRFPPIWDFFRESLRLPSGGTAYTRGNYDARNFLLRLQVPKGARGSFQVEVGDTAGNISVRSGTVGHLDDVPRQFR